MGVTQQPPQAYFVDLHGFYRCACTWGSVAPSLWQVCLGLGVVAALRHHDTWTMPVFEQKVLQSLLGRPSTWLLPETCSIAGALLSTLVPAWDLHFDLRSGSESGHSPARLRRLYAANLLHGPSLQTCLCNRCHRRRWQRRPCWCKSAVPYWAARKFHIHRALSDVSISFDFVMLWWKMIVENVVWTVMIVPHIVVWWGSCFQFCIPSAASSSSAPPTVTIFHTQLCHIQLCHTIFVTHDSFTHNFCHTTFVTHKSHTLTTLSHITLSHTTLSHTSSSHTSSSHTSLSHTTISHIQLCHTHTTLSHTTLSHNFASLSHNFATLSRTTLSRTMYNFVRHNSLTYNLVKHTLLSHSTLSDTSLSHTTSSHTHTIFHRHTQLPHTHTTLSHTQLCHIQLSHA